MAGFEGFEGNVGLDATDGLEAKVGFAPAAGLAASIGFAGAFGLVGLAGLFACGDSEIICGLFFTVVVGASLFEAAGLAFLTERMALLGDGEAVAPFFASRSRMRFASASLIELLWLFTAIESCSAASSTSLFSRPKSLESS